MLFLIVLLLALFAVFGGVAVSPLLFLLLVLALVMLAFGYRDRW